MPDLLFRLMSGGEPVTVRLIDNRDGTYLFENFPNGAHVYTQDAEPTAALEGDFWVDTDEDGTASLLSLVDAAFGALLDTKSNLADTTTADAAHTARLDTLDALVRRGTGTPEGAVTAPAGTLFLRTDGGASTTLYVKESGAGNTGWVAK